VCVCVCVCERERGVAIAQMRMHGLNMNVTFKCACLNSTSTSSCSVQLAQMAKAMFALLAVQALVFTISADIHNITADNLFDGVTEYDGKSDTPQSLSKFVSLLNDPMVAGNSAIADIIALMNNSDKDYTLLAPNDAALTALFNALEITEGKYADLLGLYTEDLLANILRIHLLEGVEDEVDLDGSSPAAGITT